MHYGGPYTIYTKIKYYIYILYIPSILGPSFYKTDNTQYVTNNSAVGTLSRYIPKIPQVVNRGGKKREEQKWRVPQQEKTLERTNAFRTLGTHRCRMVYKGVPIGNSYIHIRTQNKGLCIVTHIFNLENSYPRNNPSPFLPLPPQGQTVGFHFHAFSALRRARFI